MGFDEFIKGRHRLRNIKTGNEKSIELMYVIPYKHFPKGEYVTMSKAFSEYLYTREGRKIGHSGLLLLHALIARAEADGKIRPFKQASLAEELETHQPNIARSLAKLKHHGIISYDQEELCYVFNDKCIHTGESPRKKQQRKSTKKKQIKQENAGEQELNGQPNVDDYRYGFN